MSIEMFAPLLGNIVTLSVSGGQSISGKLVKVHAGKPDPIFVIESLGQRLVLDTLFMDDFTLELTENSNPTAENLKLRDSLNDLVNDIGGIEIRPTGYTDANLRWELYIPATQPGQLDEKTGEPVAPWGATYWATLDGALASLSLASRQGHIVFNDGRKAE